MNVCRSSLLLVTSVLVASCSGPCVADLAQDKSPDEKLGRSVRPDFSQLARVELDGLDVAGLRKKFAREKWTFKRCDEQEAEVSCAFVRNGAWANVVLYESTHAGELKDAVETAIFAHVAFVQSKDQVLTVSVTTPKLAKETLSKLPLARLPSAKEMKKTLEQMGWQAECEGETDEAGASLACLLLKGDLFGELGLIENRDEELLDDEGDEDEEDQDPGRVSLARGRITATLELRDSVAGRQLIDSLFADANTTTKQMLIGVSLNENKSDGKNWDALAGAPDPFVIVDGKSYRAQRCQDEYDCLFVVDRVAGAKVEVWDADGAVDDFAGSTRCESGRCQTADAEVWVFTHW